MGVERAVTRWYTQRHLLIEEINALEAKLAHSQTNQENQSDESEKGELAVKQQLTLALSKLRTLGPCPKPMMG